MRARGGLLEKKGEAWTRGQRVNDLLYRSLPASSRFLPVCIEPGYHPVSWNNCDRSWVRQVERNEYDRYVRCSFSVFCGLFRAGYNQVRGIVPRRIIQICSFV